jgi:phosphohistidine phosphatase SixA
MTRIKINLIRHGEKRLFLPDPSLTELGISQAEKLAQQLLAKQQPSQTKKIILSSPKKRTKETASIIAKKLGLKVRVDSFLNIDNELPNNEKSKNKITAHFEKYLKELPDDLTAALEIFAVTHSQEIRNFWQILGGPDKAIKDVYECGMWSIIIEGERIKFEWTEGDLNP